MTFASVDDLFQKPKTTDVEIDGVGTVRIQEMTRSQRFEYDAWLFPDGELDDERAKHRNLRMIGLCAINEDGSPMFDMEFDELVSKASESGSSVWSVLGYEVMKINGLIDEEEEDLLGKSDN